MHRFVRRALAASSLAAALSAAGCAPSPLFVAPQNPEPVHVELRDSPPNVQLFPANAIHVHRHGPNTIDLPLICTESPCDASVMGGTVLRAGDSWFMSHPFQLPASGTARVTVDPGSGVGMGLSSLGMLAGGLGIFAGGGLLAAGAVDGCQRCSYGSGKGEIIAGSVTLGASLALAAIGIWGFRRSMSTVTVEPVVRF